MSHLQLVADARAHRTNVHATTAGRPTGSRRAWHNGLVLALGDVTSLLLACLIGMAGGWSVLGSVSVPTWVILLPAGWIGGGFLAGMYPGWGVGRLDSLRRLAIVFAFAVSLAAIASVWAGDFVLLSYATTVTVAAALVPPHRRRAQQSLAASGAWGLPVVVYGAGDTGKRLLRHLRSHTELGLHPEAVVDENPARQGRVVEDFQVLGRPGDKVPVTDMAVIAMPDSSRRQALLNRLEEYYRQVVVLDEPVDELRLGAVTRDLDGLTASMLSPRLFGHRARAMKRTAELLVLAASLPLWLPLLASISLAVWLEDRHAPIARQARMGRDGTSFFSLRFRTTVPNTAERLQTSLQSSDVLRTEWETRFRLVDDPRITRVGKLLRRCGLTGLPRVLNVLRGEMALVGPQPLPPYRYAQLSKRDKRVLDGAAPGMFGLWSAYGRVDDPGSDIYYVRRWSIGLDLAILLDAWTDLFVRNVANGSE